MADSNIGALPQAPQVDDDSLLVMEQQGQAMKLTGAQLKGYAKQGVELEFQDNLAQSQAAADRAESAANSIVNMTVSAYANQEAAVNKSMQNGKVHLSFGLPRGEQGAQGPEGPPGARGQRGETGKGFTILGHYDTENELRTAVTAPEVGDSYSVGLETPYDIYILDGVTMDWKNYGPLAGGGGGTILPENVVTTPGGAEMTFSSGDGPHTISFDFEEEPPLTADDIVYGDSTVQEALEDLFTSVSDGKAQIASAITDKGVPTQQDATFAEMAENIGQIATGSSTEDATATPGDILAGKTAYTSTGKVTGIIPTLAAQTITPSTANKTIANGQYLGGTQTIKGDPNLTSSNIKKNVSIFGVVGALESSFQATLTVTADIGAVVTATCGDTEVSALSTTGTVVLELPIEGTWQVTAQRGMEQYNTVVIEVSSQFSATLTAEVHVEYFIVGTPLSHKVANLTGVSIGNYALFIGGVSGSVTTTSYPYPSPPEYVKATGSDAYNTSLTRTDGPGNLIKSGSSDPPFSVVTATNTYAFVWSGILSVINGSLTKTETQISFSKNPYVAASLGTRAIFASKDGTCVDAVSDNLTKAELTPFISGRTSFASSSNENYAIFAGGIGPGGFLYPTSVVDAYDKNMTRTNPTMLSESRGYAVGVRAGNYMLICGGQNSNAVDAYDLFLTRTNPEPLGKAKAYFAATTLNNVAILGGGGPYANQSWNSTPFIEDNVEIYDPYLVRTKVQDLSVGRSFLAAASVGNYALFAGGGKHVQANKNDVTTFNYYTGSTTVDIYHYV